MAKKRSKKPKSKRTTPVLNLKGKVCRLGKFSNNTEYHGDDWEGAFTFPLTGLMLSHDELNTFLRDKYAHACWYNTRGSLAEPMPWWNGECFRVSGAFEAEGLELTVSGDRVLTFTAEEPHYQDDDEADLGRPACVLSKITLTPQVGGLTELAAHLTLHPGLGKDNLLLQEHQHREIKLTLMDARERHKDKQPELPLTAPDANDSAAATVQ
jgi:hypothetical protein